MSSTIFDSTVIPFDGTDAAITAVGRISSLLSGKDVTFVMVLDQYVENALKPFAEGEGLTISQAAEVGCERVVIAGNDAGLRSSYQIVTNSEVVEGLIGAANDAGATAIVLPTHSKSGVTRWLTGNLRDKIVHASNLPVLVLPAA